MSSDDYWRIQINQTIDSSKGSLETPKRNPSQQLRLNSSWKPHQTPSAPLTHPFSSTDRDGTIHTLFPFIHIFRRLRVYCARQRKDGPTISMNSLNRYAFLLSTVVARTPSRRIRFHNIQTRFVHRTISKLILFHISAFVLFWLTSIFTHSGFFEWIQLNDNSENDSTATKGSFSESIQWILGGCLQSFHRPNDITSQWVAPLNGWLS